MKSILIIDDSVDTREIVETILTDAGYDVFTARNPKEAFQVLERESFDLLLCDLHMPFTVDQEHFEYQYSYEVGLRTIQELSWVFPSMPVIAMSATSPWELSKLMEALQHVPALSKPFSPGALLGVVNQALNREQHFAMH